MKSGAPKIEIATADRRGGKAGRGHNKTSTVQVRWPVSGGYLKMAQFRFTVGDDTSLKQATMKALAYADNPPEKDKPLLK